ncbi:MAG TPA: hypothetical protein VGQ11_10615 [Candidatus Acidoferrales bacterium]|jgi:hypothetical protein|nr:hypothetical protein [Candidatus Acidoferrales bacterium]
MSTTRTIRFAGALVVLALILMLAPGASAQCAMCANAAAAQQAEARRALNMGIAALVTPVFLLIGGFVLLSYQRRNPPDDPSDEFSGAVASQATMVNLSLDTPTDASRSSVATKYDGIT